MAETKQLPDTWEELAALLPGLPQLTPPNRLDVTQSAMFAMLTARIDERTRTLRKHGFFDGKPDDTTGIVTAVAETVDYANLYYRTIADQPDTWDQWTQGHDLYDLYVMFLTLTGWYRTQLGKSKGFITPSKPTGSK